MREIAAWKDDVFAYDIICIGFSTTKSQKYHWVDEQLAGWEELQDALKQNFDIHTDDWWSRVAFPPFQHNFTVLWTASDVALPREQQ